MISSVLVLGAPAQCQNECVCVRILILPCGGSKGLNGTGRILRRRLCTCVKLTDYLPIEYVPAAVAGCSLSYNFFCSDLNDTHDHWGYV